MPTYERNNATGAAFRWQKAPSQPGESFRWVCVDGRWVALVAGTGDELGVAFVINSDGRRVRAESFEQALALAKQWRT